MENPIKGNSTQFYEYNWQKIFDELGDEPIKESYWFAITNDVIEGSRNMRYADQNALVQSKTNSECELPTFLEAVVCCAMNHVSSGEDKTYLFGREPVTYMRTQTEIEGWPLVVGGFASRGLVVINYYFALDLYGVAASRKFC